nr:sulfotransferase 1 family member D1-like [Cherax quadricarinatus]
MRLREVEEVRQAVDFYFPDSLRFDCFLPPDFDTTGMSEDDPKIPGNTWRILQDLHLQGPELFFSPIWPHILGFWKVRNKDHILFLRYEDMKENLAAVVRQIAGFLGKEVDEEKVSWLVHHCSFGEMSKNSAANNETMMIRSTEEAKNIKFMRKGQVTRVR